MQTYFGINGAPILATAGWLSAGAAAMHVMCIWGGANWYRALGASERLARAADRGSWVPHLIAGAIALVLSIFAVYAFAGANTFSGSGIQARPPFIRTVLCTVTFVLLLRGLLIFVPDLWRPDLSPDFKFYSSAAVLVMAATFLTGTWQAWSALSPVQARDLPSTHHQPNG